MKEFDLVGLLESLEQYGINPKTALLIAAAIVIAALLALVVYVLRKNADEPALAKPTNKPEASAKPKPSLYGDSFAEDDITEESTIAVSNVTPIQPVRQEAASAKDSIAALEIAEEPAKVSATVTPIRPIRQEPAPVISTPAPKAPAATPISVEPPARKYPIPQDSILRRHHLSHVRYLVETVSLPRPTECVLLRHYEQLISSRVEECLHNDAHMEKLLKAYDEHRRNALAA